MVAGVDQDVLAGFVEEARSYLPVIEQGIESFRGDPGQPQLLETAHRFCHNIKGAASMIGIRDLSQIALYLEEIVERLMDGRLRMQDEVARGMLAMLATIGSSLEHLEHSDVPAPALLEQAALQHRRILDPDSMPGVGSPSGSSDREIAEALDSSSGTAGDDAGLSGVAGETLPPELLEVFALEAEDHLRAINLQLAGLQDGPGDSQALREIRRRVHTLKGAAASMGFTNVAQLSHRMEDLLDRLFDGDMRAGSETVQLLFDSSDTLEDLLRGGPALQPPRSSLPELYRRFAVALDPQAAAPPVQYQTVGEDLLVDFTHPGAPPDSEESEAPGRLVAPLPRLRGDVIRVPLERLDELVRLVSELVISRSAFEERMGEFAHEVEELQRSNERLQRVSLDLDTKYEVSALGGKLSLFGGVGSGFETREAAGSEEFDELQFDRYTEYHILTRELVEAASDLRTIGLDLNSTIGDFDGLVNRQARLSTQIQDKLMRTRMVPLATLTTRLHRTVRVLAREQGKLVDLVLEGENVEIDTTVLDSIVDPLVHLMRNAVDHGIEPPDVRRAAGKPERGTIDLQAYYEGSNVVIKVSDDGRGLDREKIRATALQMELISGAEAASLTDTELFSLLFSPGFTTAAQVSEVSGRGVGLEVVKNNVEKLNGVVLVESNPGQGTSYTIRLPMTLAVIRGLLVRANGETFAIPLGAVTHILRLEPDEIEHIGTEAVVRLNGKLYPAHGLGKLLNLPQPAGRSLTHQPVVILNAGTERIALVVDQLLTGREIVVKSLGSHLRRVHGIMGATLMGDGSVVLILNPAELLSRPAAKAHVASQAAPPAAQAAQRSLRIMVVDDSLSVRTVVSNLVRSAGWEPLAARDGLEALEQLRAVRELPDLILVDIEMPRMDGYELMSTLKADERFRLIPLVVLSSRAGPSHRARAMELGAADYQVKPYQDAVMVRTIRRLARASERV